ncbi:putative membrane protein [Hyphomonas neptunium ATCC 15444]|uniref:Uncharacterized protein n=2 Tax=Hyphomonas TaxID=85 RepID=A0A059FXG5_9PROT|nr:MULTISPECIES: hypothetical protein [Hyphomonas]ABI77094.1 putative membrane protein [Hyphomonas neptunium ATCC 15444]KCZ95133.1 hypothetical protein HHI_07787 [Hyphomonas hirschiana VP5]
MSLTRAILIVSWCLSLATIHAVVAFILGYLMPRNGGIAEHMRLYVMIVAGASALSAVLALLAIIYVKALWGVMALSFISAGLFLYGMLEYAVPLNLLVIGVLIGQFLFSRFAIGLNAIDNPGKPRINPSEEF